MSEASILNLRQLLLGSSKQ